MKTSDAPLDSDMRTLAKGGRTNTLGFIIRLIGGVPFLFIGYRLYGVEDMGRFASAFVIIEIFALFCALGEKRGLAQRLRERPDADDTNPSDLVFGGVLASLIVCAVIASFLLLFPWIMFPNGTNGTLDIMMVAAIPALALTEIFLAAQAFRYDIATTVRARALVEPWVKSLAVLVFFFIPGFKESGLALAFVVAAYAALLTSFWSVFKTYGLPKKWRPKGKDLSRIITRSLPLSGADVIERSTRLIDVFLLGQFTTERTVGIYFFAKEVATLPQKLKSSFEPILSPIVTKSLKNGNMSAIAEQLRQVGFWVIAVQVAIALALVIPGEAVMGLGGPTIVGGTGALAILLAAEVVASIAVVSESVLVYVARKRNLAISVGIIVFQAILTIILVTTAQRFDMGGGFMAAGAGLALFIALGTSSILKALLLKKILMAPVVSWRWGVIIAAIPAVFIGYLATFLPEWAELIIGVPAILIIYGTVLWKVGFAENDRLLFRRNLDD